MIILGFRIPEEIRKKDLIEAYRDWFQNNTMKH